MNYYLCLNFIIFNNGSIKWHVLLFLDFSEDDLVAQAVLFYVAGYDTTANLINYFLYEMALNPKVQERLQDELDRLPGTHDIKETYDNVQRLEYMEMCVNGKLFLLYECLVTLCRKLVHSAIYYLLY